MASTQLYDDQRNQIYPKGEAAGISYNNPTYSDYPTVQKALDYAIGRIYDLNRVLDGADQVKAQLGVQCSYVNWETSESPGNAANWKSSFQMPTSDFPYTWKRTIYTWGEDDNQTVIKTMYEIVSTALSPETQFMYTSVGDNSQIKGPMIDEDHAWGYPNGMDDTIPDQENPNIVWTRSPQDVTRQKPFAYIAVRSRKANESFRGRKYSIAQYGNYAFESVLIIKYHISSTPTPTDPDDNIEKWVDQISESDLKSGKNYIFQSAATSVNGTLQSSGRVWSLPSLVSIITV